MLWVGRRVKAARKVPTQSANALTRLPTRSTRCHQLSRPENHQPACAATAPEGVTRTPPGVRRRYGGSRACRMPTLGVCQVTVAWPGAKSPLRRAASSDEPVSGVSSPGASARARLVTASIRTPVIGRPSKRGHIGREAGHVVASGVSGRRGPRRTTDEMMREHQLHLQNPGFVRGAG